MEKEITTNELMEFLQENMATKADLKNLATKDGVRVLEKRIDALDSKLTVELRSIQNDLDEIKIRLTKLEKRTLEDVNAVVKDTIKLQRRVDMLEKKVRQLQSARS